MTENYLYQLSLVNTRMNDIGTLLMFAISLVLVVTGFVCYKSPLRKWLVPFVAVIGLAVFIIALVVPGMENVL